MKGHRYAESQAQDPGYVANSWIAEDLSEPQAIRNLLLDAVGDDRRA